MIKSNAGSEHGSCINIVCLSGGIAVPDLRSVARLFLVINHECNLLILVNFA